MLRPKKKITRREIKRDPLLEILFSIQKFYEKYRRRIRVMGVGLGILVLVVLIGSGWRTSARHQVEELFARGLASYKAGNYADAVDDFESLLADYRKTQAGRQALFYMGGAYLSLDNPVAAKQSLGEYVKRGRDDLLLTSALGSLAIIAQSEGDYAGAAELFQQAASKAGFAFGVQQNKIDAAASWLKAGRTDEAEKLLKELEAMDDSHPLIRSQMEELSSQLNVLSSRRP